MGVLEVKLPGRVLRVNPRRRIATVGVPFVGRGRSYRAAYAAPGEALASAIEYSHGYGPAGRTVGAVVAVRPTGSGAEVDVHLPGTWRGSGWPTGTPAWTSAVHSRTRSALTRSVGESSAWTSASRGPLVVGCEGLA
jgi:hypothetical protein